MSPEKLTYMANQIATFFASQPQDAAVEGVAGHINSFWDPRMRARLLEVAASDGDDLSPLVRAALPQVQPPKG